MNRSTSIAGALLSGLAFSVVLAFFVALRVFYGFLPFHSFAELFAIVVFFCIFLFGWHSHSLIENGFIRLAAVGFVFIGFLDALHALTYRGMNVFPIADDNAPTQLWVAARFLQAATYLVGLFLLRKKIPKTALFFVYSGVTAFIIAAVFYLKIFPDCLVGGRLTIFKIVSEYVICATLAAAAVLLVRKREAFDAPMRRFILFSLGAGILSELAFTFYNDVYDVLNFSGHLLRILSVFLFFKAVFEIGVRRPFALVFKELKQHEKELDEALKNVKTLRGLLPICASCKKIRNDRGYWEQTEEYISLHSDVVFSHGLCPDCLEKYEAAIEETAGGPADESEPDKA